MYITCRIRIQSCFLTAHDWVCAEYAFLFGIVFIQDMTWAIGNIHWTYVYLFWKKVPEATSYQKPVGYQETLLNITLVKNRCNPVAVFNVKRYLLNPNKLMTGNYFLCDDLIVKLLIVYFSNNLFIWNNKLIARYEVISRRGLPSFYIKLILFDQTVTGWANTRLSVLLYILKIWIAVSGNSENFGVCQVKSKNYFLIDILFCPLPLS